jgi:hypothetical protein
VTQLIALAFLFSLAAQASGPKDYVDQNSAFQLRYDQAGVNLVSTSPQSFESQEQEIRQLRRQIDPCKMESGVSRYSNQKSPVHSGKKRYQSYLQCLASENR